ncbi:hypothetical protein AKJ16_DCAP08902 [Drosera capensis]
MKKSVHDRRVENGRVRPCPSRKRTKKSDKAGNFRDDFSKYAKLSVLVTAAEAVHGDDEVLVSPATSTDNSPDDRQGNALKKATKPATSKTTFPNIRDGDDGGSGARRRRRKRCTATTATTATTAEAVHGDDGDDEVLVSPATSTDNSPDDRGLQSKSLEIKDFHPELETAAVDDVHLATSWEDISCSICLDYPHNSVLLQCSSFEKGCRPFVCNTSHLHSNCLERFKIAYGSPLCLNSPSTSGIGFTEDTELGTSERNCKPTCPLCRGKVSGWVINEKARLYFDMKKRCCEMEQCKFVGTYLELQRHAQLEHPNSRPSRIDPAKQLDWENFQQSSEIIDVLSTIHSETPRGVVLGDYVIEYGDDDSMDEFENFPGGEGNWWTSCILYQVFDNFRSSRNRRRSRTSVTRRRSSRSSVDTSNSDDGSVTSIEFAERRVEDDDDIVRRRANSLIRSAHRSSQRRHSRFYDN